MAPGAKPGQEWAAIPILHRNVREENTRELRLAPDLFGNRLRNYGANGDDTAYRQRWGQ